MGQDEGIKQDEKRAGRDAGIRISIFHKILGIILLVLFFSILGSLSSVLLSSSRLTYVVNERLDEAFNEIFSNIGVIFDDFEKIARDNIRKTSGLLSLEQVWGVFVGGQEEYARLIKQKTADIRQRLDEDLKTLSLESEKGMSRIAEASYVMIDKLSKETTISRKDIVDFKDNIENELLTAKKDFLTAQKSVGEDFSVLLQDMKSSGESIDAKIRTSSGQRVKDAIDKMGKANVVLVGSQEEAQRKIENIKYRVIDSVKESIIGTNRAGMITFMLSMAIIAVLVIIVSLITTRTVTRPISTMVNVLQKMTKGELPQATIDIKSSDEIGLLATTFNEMSVNLKKVTASRDELDNEIKERRRAEERLQTAYNKLRETQEQLIQAEKLNAVGQLASGVAHEVKNPLGIILQSVGYLKAKIAPNDKQLAEITSMIENNVKRADKIIRSLVDFSRATELKMSPEDINAVLENSLVLVAHHIKQGGIKVNKELKDDLPKVLVDKTKMEQVFVNLALNAIQSMSAGGTLFIRSYAIELKKLKEGTPGLKDKCVIVEIEDTGMGIPEQYLRNIFDPFFTTKGPREGAGLGLAVTKNIMDMHKAIIEVKSKKGKGTKVTITLSLTENT